MKKRMTYHEYRGEDYNFGEVEERLAFQFHDSYMNEQAALIREAREIITWAAQPKIDITANECERIGSKIVDWLEKTKEI